MIFLALFLWNGVGMNVTAHAEDIAKNITKNVREPAIIRNISLFRNEIQLDIDRNSKIKVGSKFLAQTAVNHKCLLIVKRIVRDLAYADATQCPGYATLKKGQSVSVSPEDEVNEEIRVVPKAAPQDS